ncbi:MAG: Slp family lipoprotein [Nitrospirota bacterium]
MKRVLLVLLIFSLFSCAPVLRKDLMEQGSINPPLKSMQENPATYKGRLYILGGIIVKTKLVPEGSLVEAVYVPVDSRGDLKSYKYAEGRFLALFPKSAGILEPEIYKKERKITVAGVFEGTRTGKIDEVDYVYPFFTIKQIHLWEEERPYYPYYPYGYYPLGYPYGPYSPFWYDDPFWRHRAPYPYWWW